MRSSLHTAVSVNVALRPVRAAQFQNAQHCGHTFYYCCSADPYSIITMQQFCRACTCAINRGLVTSLERAESLIGNMTARKAFLSVSTGNSTLTQVPGLAKCGSLETEVLLKSGAMTKETVSVSSSCWNLGAEFLLEVYDSCDYSRSASSGAARLTSNSHNMMLLVAVVSMMLTTMQFT